MGELDFMSREGKLVPTFNNLFIIRDDKEKIQYFANIITDIAEQKLGAEKLRKAMEEAYLANKAKSKFLANMSHEIRTPMNGILGFSDLLLDEELTNEQYEAVKAIKESGENLLGLINNILDLSKVESNKIVLESIPFDVEDVIFDVCDLMKSNLGEKPVEINCYVENVDSAITGDPTRLRQILINLVGNSVKFINEGDIHVRVCIEKEEENKVILRFMVKDTGPGIPEDKLEKIFESFQQVDGSTTRNFGGTGLGLSIAKKLCKIMGGDMWVESQVGIGSTFYFTSAFKKAGLPRETEKTMDLSRLSGRKILIVDDNKTARDIECELTEKGGMVPICFSGGKEALGYLKTLLENGYGNNEKNEMHEILPEVALLDLDMPEMSGHELSILIHGLTNKKISMIGISPRASLGNGRKSNEQYFSSYLSKPLREELFFSALLKTLGLGGTDRYRDANSLDGDSVEDKVKVLYVEDNLVNQKLGQKVLERLGHHVSIASDGREAVKMIKNGSYDIIFMDVHMPNMDGLEATKIIRKWENEFCKDKTDSAGKIPIVAATADAMKGDREKFIEAGMDGYVSKPFNRGDIQRAINGWVHKAGQSIKEGKDKRLLIVEDEDKVRKSIIRLLRRKMPHIKVTSASDGIDAAAKLGSFTPDLILADIMMPHMDGSEFVRYVRNNKRYKKIKVVMMTGLHKEDPRVLAVKGAGIENIVYKPWEDSELIAAIKEAILGVHNFH
jgi:signal transduction histidine kinase/DNA-binding response OmpR family regulator